MVIRSKVRNPTKKKITEQKMWVNEIRETFQKKKRTLFWNRIAPPFDSKRKNVTKTPSDIVFLHWISQKFCVRSISCVAFARFPVDISFKCINKFAHAASSEILINCYFSRHHWILFLIEHKSFHSFSKAVLFSVGELMNCLHFGLFSNEIYELNCFSNF